MTSFYIDTLGCAKNDYDSQSLAAKLMDRGCERTKNPYKADILIVNTCGFIEAAKRESIEHIFDMISVKQGLRKPKLVVTGCLSERYHAELVDELGEVDIFTGVNEYDELPDILLGENGKFPQNNKTAANSNASDMVTESAKETLPYVERVYEKGVYSDVIKIAEGCNNACKFCAIPMIRGKYRSKRIEDCVREACDMASHGIKELIVIAQDTSYYGMDIYGERKLPELLRRICKIDGIEWIRLMYVYDDGVTDELIDTIASESKICNYIDMPIQHISDNVLTKMGRKSTGASIRNTIAKLRKNISDIHIRTTLLVGFPGETEQDIRELVTFVQEAKIERMGAFAFSDEEGTPAHEMPDKLSEDVKQSRLDMIMTTGRDVSRDINSKKTGKTYDVIIDEVIADDCSEYAYIGRTRYDAPEIDDSVEFTSDKEHFPGDIVKVKITDAYEYDLIGTEVQ